MDGHLWKGGRRGEHLHAADWARGRRSEQPMDGYHGSFDLRSVRLRMAIEHEHPRSYLRRAIEPSSGPERELLRGPSPQVPVILPVLASPQAPVLLPVLAEPRVHAAHPHVITPQVLDEQRTPRSGSTHSKAKGCTRALPSAQHGALDDPSRFARPIRVRPPRATARSRANRLERVGAHWPLATHPGKVTARKVKVGALVASQADLKAGHLCKGERIHSTGRDAHVRQGRADPFHRKGCPCKARASGSIPQESPACSRRRARARRRRVGRTSNSGCKVVRGSARAGVRVEPLREPRGHGTAPS